MTAYTPITTPLSLKNRIISVLGDLLGTYAYPNNYTEPAISIGGRPAEGLKVSGIETRLPRSPFIPRSYWVGRNLHQDRYYDVILIQHTGNNLYACVDRLTRHFPYTNSVEIPDYDAIKILPQCRVTIYLPDAFEAVF